jgi:uncharacterized protein (DUF433 family)
MPRRQVSSVRLRPDLKQELERRARDAGTSATALYERLLDEGLRREDHPLILFRDGAAGRRPTLAGTRLAVAQVIETLRATDGESEAARIRDTADYLGIPVAHVQACVRYYAAYRDEIDAWQARAVDAAEREHEAWLREQAVFA